MKAHEYVDNQSLGLVISDQCLTVAFKDRNVFILQTACLKKCDHRWKVSHQHDNVNTLVSTQVEWNPRKNEF